jgi:hypothetical protein
MRKAKLFLAALAVSAPLMATAADVEWSGFGSFYYGQTFNKNLLPYQFDNDRPDYSSFSSMGLNVSSKVSDHATFYGQIVATDEAAQQQNFNMFAQWAFLNYKLSDNSHVKLGRQLFPALLSSENARVHFLLPGRSIPLAVSNASPFISIDGASFNQEFSTGLGKFSYGLYTGSPKLNLTSATVSANVNNSYGAQLNLEGDGWKLHGSANHWYEELVFTGTAATAYGSIGKFSSVMYTLGGRYDKNNFVFWSEYLYRDPSNVSTLKNGKKTMGNISAGYALAGYRIGKWMPRLTYAISNQDTGYTEGRTKTYGLGINYQASDTAIFKIDLERWTIPSLGNGNTSVTTNAKNDKTYANAVYAGVDFIF